jgi:tRNA-specific adenosine deaminase 3
LESLLLQHPPFCSSAEAWEYPLEIKEITVPLLAPTTVEKAALWSELYWPTFYRKTNPFGAHPSAIAKAEDELQCPTGDNFSVDEALELAEQVGEEARKQGLGVGSGCVVMERVDGQAQVVAVAGDARFKPLANADAIQPEIGPCQGNIMGHVVMRVVGMVGRKRLRCASQTLTKAAAKAESNFTKGGLEHDVAARDAFFLDTPVLPIEQEYFAKDNLKPDGYLSLKLEVFLTHEPCMMCCMALVHSRVGRVIFKHRMPKTGGLTAEVVSNDSGPVGLGYGLCWRKELNWQFMCWEYITKNQEGTVARTPAVRRGSRRGSSEKYTIAEDIQATSGANVTVSSFASIHV